MCEQKPVNESFLDIQGIQQSVLAYWEENKIFQKSVEKNRDNEMVFYDGPPFPTGKPHHGTILVSFIKDMIARYYTVRGFSVPRVWGWDCHGLPIETLAEKKLGIKDKTKIESEIGIKKFNDACREIVNANTDQWRSYVREMARWVDFDNSYKTMDASFMETVMWVFKQVYDKGLVYKDHRVTPYCYRCETSLSISDTRESDATRPRQDPAIVVKFKTGLKEDGKPVFFLSWTTTPWTLPSNLALAVKEEADYVYVITDEQVVILGSATLGRYTHVFGKKPEVIKTVKGADLVGLKYEPLFPYFAEHAESNNTFRVIAGDFVTTDEGVGIVHLAPAFGEDDYWACRKENIELVNPVDNKGCFTSDVVDYAGRNVLEANKDIIRRLRDENKLIDHRSYEHNYPHCWRCREPLIYRGMEAWYLSIAKLKDSLLARNENINWVPKTVQHGRFGKWLENARDWNISRNRYWSTPIPIWECPDCGHRDVMGSIADIKEKSGAEPADLHREYLDEINYPCSCGGTFKRIPEVMDCWFESGAMTFAQKHYPFENREWLHKHLPADFIIEYTGQIRCWFYYMHVLCVALKGIPSYKNCIVHGTILAEDGKKLSKSSKNYTDPMILMKNHGTDAFRLYLFQSNAVILGDLKFSDSGVEEAYRLILAPLWNAFRFYDTYRKVDGYAPDETKMEKPSNRLDRWILSRLQNVADEVTEKMERFAIDEYVTPLLDFLDDLTNWYIRRSRRRYWAPGLEPEKVEAYNTLYYVLSRFCIILGPVAPILTEHLYRRLTGEESVHLADWPSIPEEWLDGEAVEEFAVVREAVQLGRQIRQKNNIKNRMPLSEMRVYVDAEKAKSIISGNMDIINEELNIKTVRLIDNLKELATVEYVPDFKKLGPRLGKDMKVVGAAIRNGNVSVKDGRAVVSTANGEFALEEDELLIRYNGQENIPVSSNGSMVAGLNLEITPELKAEGLARDLVRHIQEMRKQADYDVQDRILLQVDGQVPEAWKTYICQETLAEFGEVEIPDKEASVKLDAGMFGIKIIKYPAK